MLCAAPAPLLLHSAAGLFVVIFAAFFASDGPCSGRHTQHMGTSLLKIEGVNDKKDTAFYLGKRVCYVYRASRKQQDRQGVQTTVRSIWGRVSKAHGNGGTVRAVFDTKCVSVPTHNNESLSFASRYFCSSLTLIRLCPAVTPLSH
jgi:ribosomal protein L35AE/L33A